MPISVGMAVLTSRRSSSTWEIRELIRIWHTLLDDRRAFVIRNTPIVIGVLLFESLRESLTIARVTKMILGAS
jgi:hypothetical protein